MNLATKYPIIYWNTACLITDSGELEDNGSTDYTKLAKAIGKIRDAGIKISSVDINNSKFGFEPDEKNNSILFGLKALMGVGDEIINKTIENRPYSSVQDFLNKVKPNKTAMLSLIKGGAFDNMGDRIKIMEWYLTITSDQKKRITLQNLSALSKYNLIPQAYKKERSIYEFTRYLKSINKGAKDKYKLDERAINFLTKIEKDDLIGADMTLDMALWDKKVYQPTMDIFRNWITKNQTRILNQLNKVLFKEEWDKYAQGGLSDWEMEVMCFYYHEHPLAKINNAKYGITNFKDLPENPVIDSTFTTKNGNRVNLYKIFKICGTCIARDKNKATVSLLTTDGVVDVKFRKEQFALFDKQISTRDADGTKHVAESSWFTRGDMIMVQGIRTGDSFMAKKYASTGGHTIYKITEVNGTDIILQTERTQE